MPNSNGKPNPRSSDTDDDAPDHNSNGERGSLAAVSSQRPPVVVFRQIPRRCSLFFFDFDVVHRCSRSLRGGEGVFLLLLLRCLRQFLSF